MFVYRFLSVFYKSLSFYVSDLAWYVLSLITVHFSISFYTLYALACHHSSVVKYLLTYLLTCLLTSPGEW